jgi:hypothetical protein
MSCYAVLIEIWLLASDAPQLDPAFGVTGIYVIARKSVLFGSQMCN